jgi:hypothetical protein
VTRAAVVSVTVVIVEETADVFAAVVSDKDVVVADTAFVSDEEDEPLSVFPHEAKAVSDAAANSNAIFFMAISFRYNIIKLYHKNL